MADPKPKREKRDISGWLILNKGYDVTSTESVGKVRWLFSAKKGGHAGTLDPLATGVLPIALGEATKTVPYVQNGTKIYQFTAKWGEATTTDDAEGEIVATSDHRPTAEEVQAMLPDFTGEITQIPPAFSAIKIKGERAYDLARAGKKFDVPPRQVFIDRFDIIEHSTTKTRFEVECAKGTYVRALARDLAEKLGTKAHIVALHRAQVGPFTDADAITVAQLEELARDGRDEHLRPVTEGLSDLEEISVNSDQANRIRMGNAVLLVGSGAPVSLDECFASYRGDVVAIGYIEKGQFNPSRVILAS